jgi:fatty-acyl-CoA synthase
VTYFNYVGKPLSYILATPERPDDADNTLRRVFGNEAAEADVARIRRAVRLHRAGRLRLDRGWRLGAANTGHPEGRSGGPMPGTLIINPDTGEECPRAVFDEQGRLLNAEEAIGEMVSREGGAGFEGYWRNADADAARVRNGWYWTGDLAYRDENDFFYFAGRDFDWLRVDGENFAAAPVEGILQRHPDVVLASVYAVPDAVVGRPGHGHLVAAARRHVRSGGVRRFPAPSDRPRHQVGAEVCPDHRRTARDRHHQGAQARASS